MNLEEKIAKDGFTIVKYFAEWCGPCKMMNPIMDKLGAEDNITVVSINIDDDPEFTDAQNITSVPVLDFYKDGEYMGRYSGAMPESGVRNVLEGKVALTK